MGDLETEEWHARIWSEQSLRAKMAMGVWSLRLVQMERRGGREMNGLCLREGEEACTHVLCYSVEIAIGD